MKRWWHSRLRALLLAAAKRSSWNALRKRSRRDAVAAVLRAARESQAYRTLLSESGLDLGRWQQRGDMTDLPVLTKEDTFGRFALVDLVAGQLDPDSLADVLTSSGRGGGCYGFRLTRRAAHDRAWFPIDLGLQDAFGVDDRTTLLVNCLPMGVVFTSRAVTVANVSVREDMATAILRQVGPHFGQVIVCTDPLFVRRLLDHAHETGVDWAALNASFILGEEMLAEAQRDFIAHKIGIDPDAGGPRLIGSSFGIGELGLNLLFETRETIRMRRVLRSSSEARALLGLRDVETNGLPSVFCFNPIRTFLEQRGSDSQGFGELCFTMLGCQDVIPLPRYATGDMGRILSDDDAERLAALCGGRPWLPVVLVRGRAADRSNAGLPSVEAVKEFVYADAPLADATTGAFRIEPAAGEGLRITVQIKPGHPGAGDLRTHLDRVVQTTGPTWARDVQFEFQPAQPGWGAALDYERKFSYRPQRPAPSAAPTAPTPGAR